MPLPAVHGGSRRLVVLVSDLTEILRNERKVLELEAQLNRALHASNTGLWEWDIVSGRTFFSDVWYEMLGFTPGELPQSIDSWQALCHPEDLAGAKQAIEAHLQGQTPVYSIEHRLRRKDGRWMWIRGVGEVSEREENGAPRRMVGFNIDISALKDALAGAEAASLAKSEFLANMSHEIRTPVGAILGYAELLAGMDGDDGERRAWAATVKRNAQHLLTLVNDVLDMSKIEAGRMEVEIAETRLSAVVAEVLDLMHGQARDKGLVLDVLFETPVPSTIPSDATRLRQILLNLVGNAVKFTASGSVTVSLSCDFEREEVLIRVIDTGIGMTPGQLAAIRRFDAFRQADTSHSRRFGGSGLGLRISHTLSLLLNGELSVESDYGRGSVFTLKLRVGNLRGIPLEERLVPASGAVADRSASEVQPGLSEASPLSDTCILLAEDGADNQRLISFYLKKAGARVILAETGRAAVDAVAEGSPAPGLILMDMQMPELDGYEATRQLRQSGCTLPIIALTAHAMNGDRERCLEAGCDDYLSKPVDRTELVGCCLRWISAPPKGAGHS